MSAKGGRRRTTAAVAGGMLAVTVLAAGCTPETAGGAGRVAPPAATGPADDPKPGGGTSGPADSQPASPADSPAASPPTASASPEPSPARTTEAPAEPETLMATGSQGTRVRELQARLRQIGHFDRSPTGFYGSVTVAAVRSFQGKRELPRTGGTDTVTWQRLLGMTRSPTAAELTPPTARPAAVPDERCTTGRVLCISKNSRTLSWMIDGRVLSSMDVRFGSQYTPTREGVFSVSWKSRHHVSTLYDTPMPYAMFFSGGQAVHYSPDFAARGYSGASHGCVNVRDEKKIASLFAQVKTGDKVVVYW
ncbi:peptidoglycan hydrolase-like protein with peptidoglycan-binding domain [Streptomyces fulvorobeus]|uniref:Peptidoglycan hydrolase-like protein with peptidoglycan-binding domain n=1 Tax=Streptomyces fulvorobeus TaxID=284028 RepID=A0A7Y9HDM7_9ACTN|nr:peptidoglycan hydrolase-like protein with peptidoglycan-binding domain [Streptomyces fulvorobeus]